MKLLNDRDFDKINLEEKTHRYQEEMKLLNNNFENEMLKLNNSNNFIIPNNQQTPNSDHSEMKKFKSTILSSRREKAYI